MSKLFTSLRVSEPPFWHSGRTIEKTMLTMILALSPVIALSILHWGFDAIRVMSLSVVACVGFEAAAQKLMERPISVYDFSAVFSGLILAFLLPAASPWWLVIAGAAITILLAKMSFGGLGATPLCAPLVGYCALAISWPVFMDPNAMQLSTMYVDPLIRLKYFGASQAQELGIMNLLFGSQLGALGASQVGAILLGGLFIVSRRIVRFEIPLAFIGGVFIAASCFYLYDSSLYASPLYHVFTGTVMLAAFFLAPDTSCSPNRRSAMIIYGLVGGILVVLIRVYGVYVDGVPFAVLLINFMTPLLDKIQPKPFGVR